MVILQASDARWAAFAAAQPQANIFHHPAWIELLADCYGYRPFVTAVCDVEGQICAGLPMLEVGGRVTSRRWISLPFTDHCMPLHCGDQSLRYLADNLVVLSQEEVTPSIELRCVFPSHPAIPTCSRQVLHTLTLCPDSDLMERRFHSTARRNIKVAEKRGVYIEWGEQRNNMEVFYRLHLQTRRRQGIPVQPWKFFEALQSDLIEKGLGFVLLARQNDEWLAGAVFLHWHGTLTYKYGASVTDGLNLRPNNLIFGTAIRWGCEHGYTLFDLGRTDLANSGLRAFKSSWGAIEVPLVYSALPAKPARSVTDKLLPFVQTIIHHSPLWVCRATGELLYKYFG